MCADRFTSRQSNSQLLWLSTSKLLKKKEMQLFCGAFRMTMQSILWGQISGQPGLFRQPYSCSYVLLQPGNHQLSQSTYMQSSLLSFAQYPSKPVSKPNVQFSLGLFIQEEESMKTVFCGLSRKRKLRENEGTYSNVGEVLTTLIVHV